MDIREQLSLALITRNLNRGATVIPANGTDNLREYINQRLASILPNAIAGDKETLVLLVDKQFVSSDLWNEVESYTVSDLQDTPTKFIMEDYADEVYKPYLVGSEVTKSDKGDYMLVSFYLNQD